MNQALAAGSELWLNTIKYTPAQLGIFGAGGVLWAVAYIAVIRHALREKFVVVPAAAVVANITWEFMWGFVFECDMGRLITWGYRAWFFLDCFILVYLYKYGWKQLLTETGREYLPWAITFGLMGWLAGFYFFISEGYDMSMGATSAYIDNVMMSAVYIVMVVKHPEIRRFSFTVAWTKGLGTAFISVFMFLAPLTRYGAPDVPSPRGFLLTLCILSFVLDVVFVAGFWMRLQSVPPAPAAARP